MGDATPFRFAVRIVSALLLFFPVVCIPAWSSMAAPEDGKPRRIVSLNVCTDQLLMMMVPRERIAAVSYLASNPQTSAMASEAKSLPFTYGNAEHVLLLKPDLVLAGTYTTRATVHLLRKLGMNVVELKPAARFDQVIRNIEIVGKAVGENARADSMALRMEHELSGLRVSANEHRPRAALFSANSYTSGEGSLIDSILRHAGFGSLAREMGIRGTQKLSLETLVTRQPDALVLGHRDYPGDAMAYEVFNHAALRHVRRSTPAFSLAGALTVCGTPHAVKAVERLRRFREKLPTPVESSQ